MHIYEDFIQGLKDNFHKVKDNEFVKIDTAEIYTKEEYSQYLKRELELFNSDLLKLSRETCIDKIGVQPDQRLINDRSKKVKDNKREHKPFYNGGNFNIIYREKIKELINMDLTKNEKLVFYVMRDYIEFPHNCIMIDGKIPKFTDLVPIIGLSDRSIRNALKTLSDKGIVKLVQSGVRKAIYINPIYYAGGKELDIETLDMFGLIGKGYSDKNS